MREMTSAISSESERDSLIASPSSFIIFFKRSSKVQLPGTLPTRRLDAGWATEESYLASKTDCYNDFCERSFCARQSHADQPRRRPDHPPQPLGTRLWASRLVAD